MKKYFLFSGLLILMIICTSMVLSNGKNNPSQAPIPDDVKAVVKNSCMACHGEGGKKMVMSIVNFSAWDNYSAEKQAKKASAVCNVITKGSMPPKGYLNANPGAVLTAGQKELICNWSKGLQPPAK
ncbi:MAG TPA: heme-binding domain-containing protein [Bacteroidales bacterium]|nr:heme-binding domain-containing protein [Bacteroidales bacterium]